MPGYDKTGPVWGSGPATGNRRGTCGSASRKPIGKGARRGFGNGYGRKDTEDAQTKTS